jgi:acetyl-CoA carboxylase carboxyltransferase component
VLRATFDDGEAVEIGALATNGKREDTAGDGFLVCRGAVNGRQALVCAYDYTVLAGTQGLVGHRKMDRAFELARRLRLPVLLYGEGGGGRASDFALGSGLDCHAFSLFAGLKARVPLVGVVMGFCFAGNATLVGGCDVVVATRASSLGMGGPAMIEGGGLGTCAPEDVGPAWMHAASAGAVDVLVDSDAQAVAMGRRVLGYFQPGVGGLQAAPSPAQQEALRSLVPENRKRSFDVRVAFEGVFDAGSVTELKPLFGRSMVVALARLGGRAVGVLANDSRFFSGAIDADACEKGARAQASNARADAKAQPRGSCACATLLTLAWCRSAIARGSWWGPKPSAEGWCAGPGTCSRRLPSPGRRLWPSLWCASRTG